ncbi:MAG: gliding motility-associated C-terminal domain-containing protein [Flavobacteriales bacterium]
MSPAISQNFLTVGDAFGIPLIQGETCLEADTCFTLTPNIGTQAGAVWDLDTIDLSFSFDATFCLFLGTNDANGADGFAFVMRAPQSIEIGQTGGGLGFEGIDNSVAIEFDTWDNGFIASDILDDHTGLFFNGDQTVAVEPVVPLIGVGINAEDGVYHTTRIVWDAGTQDLTMYFDDVLLISHTEDLVSNVFDGDPNILWGFTASTGGSANLQQICFPTATIILEDLAICEGETASFGFFTEGITSYEWTDEAGDFLVDWSIDEGVELTDTLITTSESGTYYLDIEFNNQTISDSLSVTVIANPIPPFELEEITLCPELEYPFFLDALNVGSFYEWQDGSNTRLLELGDAGVYSVMITEPVIGCSASDAIEINHLCEPLIIMPNVFSPNGDEFNRVFEPVTYSYIGSSSVQMFNRWGVLVFESSSNNLRWDGRSAAGNQLPDGVYYYTVRYVGINSTEEFELSGTVTMLGGED